MANNIENYIVIQNSNEEVLKEIQRVFQPAEGEWDVHSETLVERVFGEDAPAEYDRGWYLDNCGAKWLHGNIEDDSPDEPIVRITSAWDPINGFIERLASNLRKIKSDVIVHNTFEDEGYNFAGVYYTSEEYDDTEYADIEEYDVDVFWGDDEEAGEEARQKLYDEMHDILDMHKQSHIDVIEDMKLNPENYI
jgi:hypothetical protein